MGSWQNFCCGANFKKNRKADKCGGWRGEKKKRIRLDLGVKKMLSNSLCHVL
jgi:hypothetical protein